MARGAILLAYEESPLWEWLPSHDIIAARCRSNRKAFNFYWKRVAAHGAVLSITKLTGSIPSFPPLTKGVRGILKSDFLGRPISALSLIVLVSIQNQNTLQAARHACANILF